MAKEPLAAERGLHGRPLHALRHELQSGLLLASSGSLFLEETLSGPDSLRALLIAKSSFQRRACAEIGINRINDDESDVANSGDKILQHIEIF